MKKLFSFFVGVLVGGVVGAVVALLLAPSSGQTLQQNLTEKIQQLSGEVKQAIDNRRNELEEELQQLRKADVRLE